MLLGIVNWERIPGLELLLANNASVGKVEVYLCMPLHLCSIRHCPSTSLTLILQWASIFYPCYHWLQQRIQVYKETYVIYNVRILWIIVEGNYSGWNINSQPTPSLQRKRESRIKFKHKNKDILQILKWNHHALLNKYRFRTNGIMNNAWAGFWSQAFADIEFIAIFWTQDL